MTFIVVGPGALTRYMESISLIISSSGFSRPRYFNRLKAAIGPHPFRLALIVLYV